MTTLPLLWIDERINVSTLTRNIVLRSTTKFSAPVTATCYRLCLLLFLYDFTVFLLFVVALS